MRNHLVLDGRADGRQHLGDLASLAAQEEDCHCTARLHITAASTTIGSAIRRFECRTWTAKLPTGPT